jgi:hypothetical protein
MGVRLKGSVNLKDIVQFVTTFGASGLAKSVISVLELAQAASKLPVYDKDY